jgi:hypothetical protein
VGSDVETLGIEECKVLGNELGIEDGALELGCIDSVGVMDGASVLVMTSSCDIWTGVPVNSVRIFPNCWYFATSESSSMFDTLLFKISLTMHGAPDCVRLAIPTHSTGTLMMSRQVAMKEASFSSCS